MSVPAKSKADLAEAVAFGLGFATQAELLQETLNALHQEVTDFTIPGYSDVVFIETPADSGQHRIRSAAIDWDKIASRWQALGHSGLEKIRFLDDRFPHAYEPNHPTRIHVFNNAPYGGDALGLLLLKLRLLHSYAHNERAPFLLKSSRAAKAVGLVVRQTADHLMVLPRPTVDDQRSDGRYYVTAIYIAQSAALAAKWSKTKCTVLATNGTTYTFSLDSIGASKGTKENDAAGVSETLTTSSPELPANATKAERICKQLNDAQEALLAKQQTFMVYPEDGCYRFVSATPEGSYIQLTYKHGRSKYGLSLNVSAFQTGRDYSKGFKTRDADGEPIQLTVESLV